MKPSFALMLGRDGIGLWQRTASGWLPVGEVTFDDPDLDGRLGQLRAEAEAMSPTGFTTKLVIPDSEILYDTVTAPGPRPAQRRAQIAAAMDGRTPYTPEELVYDWSGTGDDVRVAVVARETLAEAEGFASTHGFNPVSFVARPADGSFEAEPWFGLTEAAATLVPEGRKLARDSAPMLLLPVPAAQPEPEPLPLPDPEPVPEPAPEPVAEPGPLPEPEAEPEPAPAPEPAPVAAPEPAPAADWTKPAVAATEPELIDQLEAEFASAAAEASLAFVEPSAAPAAPVEPSAVTADPALPVDPAPEPLAAEPPRAADQAPAKTRALDNDPLTATIPAPFWTQTPAPAPDETEAWAGEDDSAAEAATLDATRSALAASLQPPAADKAPRVIRPLPADDIPAMPAGAALRPVRTKVTADLPDSPPLSEKMQKALGKAARAASRNKAKVTRSAAPADALPPSAATPPLKQPRSEAEAMTVFGERNTPIGGKPRYLGLALTGGLLLVLLAIAVWAAVFLEPKTDTSALSPAAWIDNAHLAPEAAAEAEARAPADSLAAAPDPDLELVAEPASLRLSQDEAPLPVAEPAIAAVPEAAPAGAAAGSAATSTARSLSHQPVEELTLPLPDPALQAPPRPQLAAPAARDTDLPPGGIPVLQEFDALYQFAPDGSILPTPQGVMTPDGVWLVAGRPARVPPARPADPEPAAAAQPAETAPATTTDTPGTTAPASLVQLPEAGPAANGYAPATDAPTRRPRLRPADATAPASDVQGALPTEIELQPDGTISRRPAARPASIAVAYEAEQSRRLAEAAQAAATAASTAGQSAALSMAPTRRPASRPANFSRSVEAAVAASVAQPRAATPESVAAATRQSVRTAVQADDDDGEPEVTTRVQPNIPTRASVARQATVTGALNLGRTNLIGVFGTTNSRYALVRESGGRLVRVRVGDRLDGGRVVSIGQSELNYQRGGNTVRLQLPRS